MDNELEYAYRYYSYWTNNKMRLGLEEFLVLRHTPKGYWIDTCGAEKFVLKDSLRGYAKLTKEAAFEHFQAIKRRQIKIVRGILHMAEESLRLTLDSPELPV
jgi:hypothetical protein